MSKRSFSDFSSQGRHGVDEVLRHADELLKVVQGLKQDLEHFSQNNKPEGELEKLLERHNKDISSSSHALVLDESACRKRHKIDGAASIPSSSLSLSIPPPVVLTAWTPEDMQRSKLPPLPPVMDPILEQAALTHPGMTTKPGQADYDRLEWIGDAYIYLLASAFIYQTFPNLASGRCSQLRERLVKNEALSSLTLEYGIDKRTKLPAEFDRNGRLGGGTEAAKKNKKKVWGDIFEAYVGASILSDLDGLARVVPWLKACWCPLLRSEIQVTLKDGKPDDSNPGPQQGLPSKVVLSQLIGAKLVKITYKDVGEPMKEKHSGLPWYCVGVFYDGFGENNLQLALGYGFSKKDAGQQAATRAIENKKLIKRLQSKKEQYS
ncbi:ribonuclease III [Xylariomycetidae sp. FL2044]|nr:ribonuclease III [Xylariomycetidae sp. FL2044]